MLGAWVAHDFYSFEGDTMIRSELVQKLVDENPHLHQRDVEKIVALYLKKS